MRQLVRESVKKKRAGLSHSVTMPVVTPTKPRPHAQSQTQSNILTGLSVSTTDYLYASQAASTRTAGLNSQNTDAWYRKELDRAASDVVPVAKPANGPARRTSVWEVDSPYGDEDRDSPGGQNQSLREISYTHSFRLLKISRQCRNFCRMMSGTCMVKGNRRGERGGCRPSWLNHYLLHAPGILCLFCMYVANFVV